jgi:glutamate--cysteine ligase
MDSNNETTILMGIESEALRIDSKGQLATTPHPSSLYIANITKDFSESQLEAVTDPHSNIRDSYKQLTELYDIADSELKDEALWPFSIPPQLPVDEEIPIATFGSSEKDRIEHIYRLGLASRYGIKKQMISGIHINVSLAHAEIFDNSNELYLNATRYLYKHMDTLILLTGASPHAAKDFPGSSAREEPVISIRNGKSGYSALLPGNYLNISTIDAYINGIKEGLDRIHSSYNKNGIVCDGKLIQLNNRVFQNEKEFYAPIRLRQSTKENETQIQALKSRGIGYLELRFFDKDPFYPGGVNPKTLNLVKLMFLQGLHNSEEKNFSITDSLERAKNSADTPVKQLLNKKNKSVQTLMRTSVELLNSLRPLASKLDKLEDGHSYIESIEYSLDLINTPEKLPSWRINEAFIESLLSWTEFGNKWNKTLNSGEKNANSGNK